MTYYLPNETIVNVMHGIVYAGMCTHEERGGLLAGIDAGYVASLPVLAAPLAQFHSDILEMNGVPFLENSQVPLRIWLANAVNKLEISGRPQLTQFQTILDEVVAESERRLEMFALTGEMEPSIAKPFALPATASQKEYRTRLEDFLLPFQGVLRLTRSIFDNLRDERELVHLEAHPGSLQAYFASLPDEDPRKSLWKMNIDQLQDENRRGVGLVQDNYGKIVLPEFRAACDEYLKHAKLWAVVWEGLKDHGSVPVAVAGSGKLYAPRFPAGLETALSAEIAEVTYRAGG